MFILSRYLFMFYSAQASPCKQTLSAGQQRFVNSTFVITSFPPNPVLRNDNSEYAFLSFPARFDRTRLPSSLYCLLLFGFPVLFRTSPLPALPVHSILKNILQHDFLSFQSKFSRCPCCPVLYSIHMFPIFSFYFSRLFVRITFLALLARANENQISSLYRSFPVFLFFRYRTGSCHLLL